MRDQGDRRRVVSAAGVLAAALAGHLVAAAAQSTPPDRTDTHFQTGVEIINVTVTVTDRSGRFVADLAQDDFRVYEDDEPVDVTHFGDERVPMSLGIILDTSGSMAGERLSRAREALGRLFDLLEPDDEIFLTAFSTTPVLVADWTTDRDHLNRALARVRAGGGTALYDAVADAVSFAQTGRHPKKAIVLVSDGNDTNSRTSRGAVKRFIRETEVLVYAIGIDGRGQTRMTMPPLRLPIPWPGRRGPIGRPRPGGTGLPVEDRLNVPALRDLTDDSGGRTEAIRSARDLDPATAGVADELSRQYLLGYPGGRYNDGRWHAIRVEVGDGQYRVRHRQGYIATP